MASNKVTKQLFDKEDKIAGNKYTCLMAKRNGKPEKYTNLALENLIVTKSSYYRMRSFMPATSFNLGDREYSVLLGDINNLEVANKAYVDEGLARLNDFIDIESLRREVTSQKTIVNQNKSSLASLISRVDTLVNEKTQLASTVSTLSQELNNIKSTIATFKDGNSLRF